LSESLGGRTRPVPALVSAYDVIVKNCVASYVELSFSIDAEVYSQANKVLPKYM
jgi:hypothetical protein